MKILVLTFYYHPDLSAGSFRATAVVAALQELAPKGSRVDVITTLPNRYATFTAEAAEYEDREGVRIHRVALGPHKSGMLDQSIVFLQFARAARRIAAAGEYDLVFATSSRLMTAVLGAWIAKRKGARLYLDLRDIFVETITDVLQGPIAGVLKVILGQVERFPLGRADRVNLVSAGFLGYFQPRYPRQHFSCLTNGVDDEFLHAGPSVPGPLPHTAGPRTLMVVYAGNLGEGQGLHRVIPALARGLGSRVRFRIIGDGGRRQALEDAIAESGVTNVEVCNPVDRTRLLREYQAADVLFLHLNDYPAFARVLPSKLFECAAMGKPVWAGVSGFAAEFTRAEIVNSAVFRPCDAADGMRALQTLRLEETPRPEFVTRFGRAALTRQLAEDVLRVGDPVAIGGRPGTR